MEGSWISLPVQFHNNNNNDNHFALYPNEHNTIAQTNVAISIQHNSIVCCIKIKEHILKAIVAHIKQTVC